MRKISIFLYGFVVVAALFSALALSAQESITGHIAPMIIDIAQDIPVLVDVTLPSDDGAITTTVPITLGIRLRVNIDAPGRAAAKIVSSPTPQVVAAAVAP